MFLKSLLNKLKQKRKPKLDFDEKLMIGRELGNIVEFRSKTEAYRWTAIYEYFKSIDYKATMDEITEYFLFGHFTRYEIVDLTTSDSITFRVLEDYESKLNLLAKFEQIKVTLSDCCHLLDQNADKEIVKKKLNSIMEVL